MAKSNTPAQYKPGELSAKFLYARELERTSFVKGQAGSALDSEEYAKAANALDALRSHILSGEYYTSVMDPVIVKPGLLARGVKLSDEEIRQVLCTDPMKGSAPCLKLMLDTPDLKFHQAGITLRISEKTKPSGKDIKQAVKLDIGHGNHDRLEFEHIFKDINSQNPKFRWSRLSKDERGLIQDRMQTSKLSDMKLKVWMFLFGSNWQTEYMPGDDKDILLKQKHDRYHIRDIFGWEAYIAKAEIEADQGFVQNMLSRENIDSDAYIKRVIHALDSTQDKQLKRFPDTLERETRSIYQTRFDEIATHILPRIKERKNGLKDLSDAMGTRGIKYVNAENFDL